MCAYAGPVRRSYAELRPDELLLSYSHVAFVLSSRAYDPTKGCKFSTWCYRAMRNATSNAIRKQIKHNRCYHAPDGADGERYDFVREDKDESISEGDISWMRSALPLLPPQLQKVLQYRFFDGMKYREMARKLGLSKQRAAQLVDEGLRLHALTKRRGATTILTRW